MFRRTRRSPRRTIDLAEANRAIHALELPAASFKTCPWQPRELVETGLRQWLRCCGAALRDGQVIGMPSRVVDEAWHGFILCTERYAQFCSQAYGQFLHHYPEGEAAHDASTMRHGSMSEQLGRTVVAWTMVADPRETCVLWDLDTRMEMPDPWGISAERVTAIRTALGT